MREFGESDKLVSIVVPVYNASEFLEATYNTVKAQSYENWELILVDDCSKDSSFELSQQLTLRDRRVIAVKQDGNKGAAMARNLGLCMARGRYLCFLDADDIWEPDKLEKQLEYVLEKQAGFCFTGYEFADEEGNGLGKVVRVPTTITYKEALKNTTIFTSTVMIDRSMIDDKYIKMPCIASEDTATWWNILKRYGKGYGLNLNLVKYRRSSNTLSSNKFVAIQRIWNLYRKHEGLSLIKSGYCMCFWALRAVFRRI